MVKLPSLWKPEPAYKGSECRTVGKVSVIDEQCEALHQMLCC